MKEFLNIVKDQFKSLILYIILGLSLGYNIKQYNKINFCKKFESELFDAYLTSIDSNIDLHKSIDVMIDEMKKNKIKFKNVKNVLYVKKSVANLKLTYKKFERLDSLYFSK